MGHCGIIQIDFSTKAFKVLLEFINWFNSKVLIQIESFNRNIQILFQRSA